jgi:hypothetical protein
MPTVIVTPSDGQLLAGFALLTVIAAGCATGRAHENFKAHMDAEVGKSANDRYAFRNHYPEWKVSDQQLPNGNIEEKFRAGRGTTCYVFFEINRTSQRIIGWRYEGTQEDCSILP